jgi:hypothetical protein
LTDKQKAQMISAAMDAASRQNVSAWAQTTDPTEVQSRLMAGRQTLGRLESVGATP